MTTRAASLESLDITTPDMYVERGYPHDAWRVLREQAPVYRYERSGVAPFWAVTKHADIGFASRNPETFASGLGVNMRPQIDDEAARRFRDAQRLAGAGNRPMMRMILTMDPPEHGIYRGFVNKRFTPRALAPLEAHMREFSAKLADGVARHLVDGVAGESEVDFVTEISSKLPLALIAEMLGVPREDWDLMFDLSNRLIGAGDPEYANESMSGAGGIFGYFAGQLAQRRANPGDDLISVLANSEVDGQPIADTDILSYCLLLIVAGNETTRNATTGGMLALIEHSEQFEQLRANPGLVPSAVEEILRWTTPVIHFTRYVTQDAEIRGQEIKAGEWIALFYPSANRDEEIFDEPQRFDITRSPNDHLAFGGFGEHFCLGSNLARLELNVIFDELARRVEHVEQTAPIERLRSNFVGGIKHMPVRMKVRTG